MQKLKLPKISPLGWAAIAVGGLVLFNKLAKGANTGPGVADDISGFTTTDPLTGEQIYVPMPKPTLTESNAKKVAHALENAFSLWDWDDSEVIELLEKYNGADLRRIYDAFGERSYLFGGSGPGWFGSDLDLFQWFVEELDDDDLAVMRLVWKRSGLPISF